MISEKNLTIETTETENQYKIAAVEIPNFGQSQDAFEYWEGKIDGKKTFIVAVGDGHGLIGFKAAELATKEVVSELKDTKKFDRKFWNNLFDSLHQKVRAIGKEEVEKLEKDKPSLKIELKEGEEKDFGTGGTTLTVAIWQGNKLTVAYVGDCEIRSADRFGCLHQLTPPHGINNPAELRKLTDLGAEMTSNSIVSDGLVINRNTTKPNRTISYLGPTRNLGDAEFGDLTSHVPTVIETDISQDTRFFLVASDGLWKKIDSRSKREKIEKILKTASNSETAKQAIKNQMRQWEIDDDVTIVIIEKK